MSERKIVVPEGMLKAVASARIEKYGVLSGWTDDFVDIVLNAALRWLADNPIVPTWQDIQKMSDQMTGERCVQSYCSEWQRRMLLAPEPEIPAELLPLMLVEGQSPIFLSAAEFNTRLTEAYRLGQQSQEPPKK